MTDVQRWVLLRLLSEYERLTSEHIMGKPLWTLTGETIPVKTMQPLVEAGYIEGKRAEPPQTYLTVWTLTDEGRKTAELIAKMIRGK